MIRVGVLYYALLSTSTNFGTLAINTTDYKFAGADDDILHFAQSGKFDAFTVRGRTLDGEAKRSAGLRFVCVEWDVSQGTIDVVWIEQASFLKQS